MSHAIDSGPPSAPEWLVYCPRCGTRMVTEQVIDKPRRVCPNCRYVHYTDPKVGVGVLISERGRVLLVRRGVSPEKGKWSIPAGYLDQGEEPRETAAREVLEETGLTVNIGRLLDVYHNPPGQGGASIFILYDGEAIGGRLESGDDADEAEFFALDSLPELAFPSTRHALAFLKSAQANRPGDLRRARPACNAGVVCTKSRPLSPGPNGCCSLLHLLARGLCA